MRQFERSRQGQLLISGAGRVSIAGNGASPCVAEWSGSNLLFSKYRMLDHLFFSFAAAMAKQTVVKRAYYIFSQMVCCMLLSILEKIIYIVSLYYNIFCIKLACIYYILI